MLKKYALLPFIFVCITACQSASRSNHVSDNIVLPEQKLPANNGSVTIHVLVALCDNKYQGIVKVPAGIGNGQQPATNLYWGAGYGIAHFFKKKDSDWVPLQTFRQVSDTILERILFKHKKENIYLLADAYDGRHIRQTTIDFLQMSSGKGVVTVKYKEQAIYFGGAARLISYVGHDGLMDFSLSENFTPVDTLRRDAMILACYSKRFFASHLKQTGARPVLWTTHLMAPEAYTLHDAMKAWIKQQPPSAIADAAAAAYAKYQRCTVKTARKLLVSGW